MLLACSADDIPDMTITDVAGMSYEDLDAVLQHWAPPSSTGSSAPASILLKSRVRRMLKACKLVLGIEWTAAATAQYTSDREATALEA